MNNRPKFYLLIGLPGSGKSTWLKENFIADHNNVILSTDDIIEELAADQGLTYSDIWSKSIKFATKEMNRRFDAAITVKLNIAWDQTNLSVKKRTSVLDRVPKIYEKIGCVFNTPFDEIERRIKLRAEQTGKYIPKGVLINMIDTFEQPSLDEGFDRIIIP